MLTSAQLDSASPLAVLLTGQPQLRASMRLGVLAALDQRIGVRYAMAPMTPAETSEYLRHHTKLAGRSDQLFSDDAAELIHQAGPASPARSTGSLQPPCSPPAPRTRPSPTPPPSAPPSPR